jgi:soluble lytic murein transglycosylase
MAQAAHPNARARSGGARPAVKRRGRARGRIAALLAAVAFGAAVAATLAGIGPVADTVRQFTLPLKHEDIIRQQASAKGINAALIAAVIYEESKFRDQTSHAGARGLMQITPATAEFIAHDSGGTAFNQTDLATPQVNIAYGAYYLRYLLKRYNGNESLAIAAYNAGETNVNKWIQAAGGAENFSVDDIPFPETRQYVKNVLERKGDYRKHYGSELGL